MVKLRNGETVPKQEPPSVPPMTVPKQEPMTTTSKTAGTRKKASKRASTTAVDDEEDIKPAKVPASASRARRDVTLEDTDAFDCGICFLPLKPPIFQCHVGHVLCSPCLNKLKSRSKCHVCGTTSGFRRCHAMERVVESIHMPCPNSASGCTAKPTYHEQQSHKQTCMVLSRFRCPGKDCDFVGSMETLLDHFTGVHHWLCTTKMRETKYESCKVCLRNGFNFVRTNLPSATATTSTQLLFLLNLDSQVDGAAISVLCIRSHPVVGGNGQGHTLKDLECKLTYSKQTWGSSHPRNDDFIQYYLSSQFRVTSTDFSEGLPKHGQFKFVVPKGALRIGSTGTVEIDFNFDTT